jgi:hypothetical protein
MCYVDGSVGYTDQATDRGTGVRFPARENYFSPPYSFQTDGGVFVASYPSDIRDIFIRYVGLEVNLVLRLRMSGATLHSLIHLHEMGLN